MFFKNKRYTCIDVGNHNIKVVNLEFKNKKIKLNEAKSKKLPPNIRKNGIIVDYAIAGSELKDIVNSMNNISKNIITTIPNKDLLIREIEIPVMKDSEVKEALKWEINNELPYDVESAVFDYVLIKQTEKKVIYMVIVVKENILNNYLDILKKADLKAKVVNIQPMALLSILEYQSILKESAVIIDIGALSSQITIANKKEIYLSRTVDVGGIDFTNTIMETKNLDFKTAEQEKHKLTLSFGDEKDSDYNLDLNLGFNQNHQFETLVSKLSSEITRSVEFVNMKNKKFNFNNIYITGGASKLSGLKKKLEEELSYRLIPINCFKDIEFNMVNSEKINENKEEFSIAIGLGLSEVIADEN